MSTLKELLQKATPVALMPDSSLEERRHDDQIHEARRNLAARCNPQTMALVLEALELTLAIKHVAMLEQIHDHQGVQEIFSKHLVNDLQMLGRKAIELSEDALNALNALNNPAL